MNSFEKWTAEKGGASKVARLLRVTPHAVRRWIRGEVTPRSHTIKKILKLSRGRVRLSDLFT